MSWRHRSGVAVLATAICAAGIGLLPGHFGAAQAQLPALWPGWDIARGIAVSSDSQSGYLLDGWGGVHPFSYGSTLPVAVTATSYWAGWDIARGIVLRSDGVSGYTLDGWGGVHPFGSAGNLPPTPTVLGYWPGWDIARGIVLRSDGVSGYTLDGYGGVHAFGPAGNMPPPIDLQAYWNGWDIARGISLNSDDLSGYTLDGFGGVHPFGVAGHMPVQAGVDWYAPGHDLARAITRNADGTGYVLESNGTVHAFGAATQISNSPGNLPVTARSVAFAPGATQGVVLDGYGAVYRVGNTPAPSPTATATSTATATPTGTPVPTGTPLPTGTPTATATPNPTATATATPTPTPRPVTMKPPLVGLLDRAHQPDSQFYSVMGGWVVNVDWADVQPNGTDELNTGTIDRAISAVDAVNAQYGTSMGLKLRLFAGQAAPGWVKNLDGAPFTLSDPNNGSSGTVGRWWTDNYRTAYDHLQLLLAARYDTAPELREVVISRCTSIYAEPMIRQGSDPANVAALLGAGYTVQADQQCQLESIAEHAVWQHTRSDLAFNPYQSVTASGVSTDEAFTESTMTDCQQILGSRCGIENNSLSDTRTTGHYPDMYAAMTGHAPGLTIQTATLARMTSLQATLQIAVDMGISSVELPSGYQTYPLSMFASLSVGLAANPGF